MSAVYSRGLEYAISAKGRVLVPLNSGSTVPVCILEMQFFKPVVRHVRIKSVVDKQPLMKLAN